MSLRLEDVLRYDVTSNKLVKAAAKRERYIMYIGVGGDWNVSKKDATQIPN